MTTVEQNRRTNLVTLAKEAGGNVALAKLAGFSEAMISQWIHGAPDSRTKKARGMRPDTCRRLETAMHKPTGWMDADHGAERAPVTAITNPALRLAVDFDALPDVLDWTWPNGRHATKTDVLAELLTTIAVRRHKAPEGPAPADESTRPPAPGRQTAPGKARVRPKSRSGGMPT
jgi:hypothetical protein